MLNFIKYIINILLYSTWLCVRSTFVNSRCSPLKLLCADDETVRNTFGIDLVFSVKFNARLLEIPNLDASKIAS